MTDFIRSYLTGIITVSLLSSAAVYLTENSSGRKYIKFLASLAVMLAVTVPVIGADVSISSELFEFKAYTAAEVSKMSDEYFSDALSQELSEQVMAAAERLGINCLVQVQSSVHDGAVTPEVCRVYCPYNDELSAWIKENLGIQEIAWNN